MNLGKGIFIAIIFIGISVAASAAVSNSKLVAEEEKRKEAERKFIESMRNKYKDINSFNDFYEGVKYVQFPSLFGYDMRILKDKKIENIITLEELKFLYDTAKVGLQARTNEQNEKFLNIMHKIYP